VPELEAREDVNADVNNEKVQNNESQNRVLDIRQKDRVSAEKPSYTKVAPKALQNVHSASCGHRP
jgi:hypothetical protein